MDGTLHGLIQQLPRLPKSECARIARLVGDNGERNRQLRTQISQLQSMLDELRLRAKCMAFDLEITRQENAYLRLRRDLDAA